MTQGQTPPASAPSETPLGTSSAASPRADSMRDEFCRLFGKAPQAVFFSPGRVNLIGEHTDFNGGHVFPCAITLGIWAAARKRTDNRIRLFSLNKNNVGMQEFTELPAAFTPANDWTNYPLGVLDVLAKAGHPLPSGQDILYWGDLPNGAGLSSSASMEVLTGIIANEFFGFGLSLIELALLAQKAENNFVGVRCGIMDQFTVAMGRKDQAILLDCNTLKYRYSPLAFEHCKLVITNTNKPHSLASSKYNERRAQCETALADLKTVLPNLTALGELDGPAFAEVSHVIRNADCLKRARHAVLENQRTLQAVDALEANDSKLLGELMRASHISLRDDFEVSCPELDVLAELAWKEPGVIGSRMTGGGFGGCTVSLVLEEHVNDFRSHIGEAYTKATGLVADFYITRAADGAHRVPESQSGCHKESE